MLTENIQLKSLMIPVETIGRQIFLIRGVKVMLSSDLAKLYNIETRSLNQSVVRNISRFPRDFMFQLTRDEFENLKSQFVISSWGGARRAMPYVFTEHGVAMLSSVLKSKRAIEMNIIIIRAFIKIREILASNRELAYKVEKLEQEQKSQNRHINAVYSILEKLINDPLKTKDRIGFAK